MPANPNSRIRTRAIVATTLLAAAGCSTNAPYEPAERAAAPIATTQPAAADAFADVAPAPVAEAPATPPAAASRTHVVARDDTFYSLSKKYYGTGAKWTAIRDANPGVTPERLSIGKTIVIP